MNGAKIARAAAPDRQARKCAFEVGHGAQLSPQGLAQIESAKEMVDLVEPGVDGVGFGKRTGQAGFDLRADVVKDGVIDVRDLAFVTQRLPAGTKCP